MPTPASCQLSQGRFAFTREGRMRRDSRGGDAGAASHHDFPHLFTIALSVQSIFLEGE
jgi:hypothetical protein